MFQFRFALPLRIEPVREVKVTGRVILFPAVKSLKLVVLKEMVLLVEFT